MRAGTRMQTKMVDYVLLMEPDAKMHVNITRILNEGLLLTDRSIINHFSSEGLRFKPIAVGVETKRAAIDEDAAHVQLSLWVSAQFAKLRQLVLSLSQHRFKTPNLPILPFVVVQVHLWKLSVASSKPPSPTSSSTSTHISSPISSIVILRDVPIGTTVNVLGCFTIIASPRRLMLWVSEDFRMWWEKVLGVNESHDWSRKE